MSLLNSLNLNLDYRIYNPYGVYLKSYYINMINQTKSNLISHQNQTQFDKFKQNNPVNPKMNALQLGEIGESWIANVLKEFGYIRTGSENHVCDGRIEFEHVVLLVEIKNKIKITADDIAKFKFDIDYYSKNKTSKKVFGVFISLNSDFQELNLSVYESYIPKKYISKETLVALVKLVKFYDGIIETTNNFQLEQIQLKLDSLNDILRRSSQIIERLDDTKKLEQTNYNEIQQQINILNGTIQCIDLKIHDEQSKIIELKKYISEHPKWKCKDVKNILGNIRPNGLKSFTKNDISNYINDYLFK